MISALPLRLGARLAGAVDAVAIEMGVFAEPCGFSDAPPSEPGDTAPHIFVELGEVEWDSGIGQRSPGEEIAQPFMSDVVISLMGPEDTQLGGAERTPPDASVDGRDLMLSVAIDALTQSSEVSNQAIDGASVIANGRRHAAEWRCDTIGQTISQSVGDRTYWSVSAQFRGKATLSAVPAEGGRILRAEISQTAGDRHATGVAVATVDLLPLSYFAAIGEDNANRLASFGLEVAGDVADIPLGDLKAKAAATGGADPNLGPSLEALHAILNLRRQVEAAGLIGGQLFARHARLFASDIWDDDTDSFTPPGDMRDDQLLRTRLLAEPLLPLLSDSARPKVTFGQLTHLKGDRAG